MIARVLRRVTLGISLLAVACSPPVEVQQEREMPAGLEPPSARFAVAPKVGDLFPDVTIFDDRGQATNIRSLAGEKPYTVLTLGCLT